MLAREPSAETITSVSSAVANRSSIVPFPSMSPASRTRGTEGSSTRNGGRAGSLSRNQRTSLVPWSADGEPRGFEVHRTQGKVILKLQGLGPTDEAIGPAAQQRQCSGGAGQDQDVLEVIAVEVPSQESEGFAGYRHLATRQEAHTPPLARRFRTAILDAGFGRGWAI